MDNTKLINSPNPGDKILKVKIERGNSTAKEFYFKDSFNVGRSEECSIRIDEGVVSRVHIEVIHEDGVWWIVDKHSSNGTFFNGSKIDKLELKNTATIELGKDGPILLFTFETKGENTADAGQKSNSVEDYIQHYFDESRGENEIGEHTRMMRQAFKVVKKKQTSKYVKLIIVASVVAASAIGYAVYQHIKEGRQKVLAENIFYEMKSLELEISNLKEKLSNSKDVATKQALQQFDNRHKELENNYDKLVDELGVYNMDEEDKLIIKTARVFGECELNMPKDFVDEVKNYIGKWRSSSRLVKALGRAKKYGYTQVIIDYLIRQHLTPDFFYLALQESDFKDDIVGPQTRYGYAKGIWQFVPSTAQKYGLTIGPLAGLNVYDPRDDRYNIIKASNAAARYLNDIYNTDAQASGLLVIASYNWGEHNIIDLIRKMPANPRDRNFWKLLAKYKDKIPTETYNYVFYIFSAAVIGQDPKLFGYNFSNPLGNALKNVNNLN